MKLAHAKMWMYHVIKMVSFAKDILLSLGKHLQRAHLFEEKQIIEAMFHIFYSPAGENTDRPLARVSVCI